jgi:two-component system, LytTR family, response regulator
MYDNKPLRCLIADDEPPAREVIRRYVEQVPTLQLAAECSNALTAMGFLQRGDIDLLFLDIKMPQLSGIELIRTIKNPPMVILTTAYTEYALEGYELDVLDYLMKPVQFDRFLKAVNKAFERQGRRSGVEPAVTSTEDKTGDTFVYFRVDRKMVKVMLDEILYIESMKDYVKVFTTRGTVITKQSITSLEAMLPQRAFLRTHRSYIVSARHIRSFSSEVVEVDKIEIPIGKLFRNEVLKVLG